jgi:hypothetical protein
VPFTDYFKGFENVGAVRAVFGEKTEPVLQRLKVGFVSNKQMYMGIRDADGNLGVGTFHLRNSDLKILYLDIVHELFHVKQFMNDKRYFRKEHMRFMMDRRLYYSSPIEVPAYKHTVREAERIGMGREEIVEYLKMGPAPPEVFRKFVKEMEIKKQNAAGKQSPKFPVEIERNPKIALFPFSDYFRGFEKVQAVEELFHGKTRKVLGNLKIEFVDFPWRAIFPSDNEDQHLVVGIDHLKKSDIVSLYLDVYLNLNLLKRASEEKSSSLATDEEFGNSKAAIESYKAMLEEARRLGVTHSKIMERFELLRFFMSPKDYQRFLKKLSI